MAIDDLLGQSADDLQTIAAAYGQPAYRARQMMRWLYAVGVDKVGEMTDLPKSLRQELERHYRIGHLKRLRRRVSQDGTVKLLLRAQDGGLVEAVLIVEERRRTACVSSQVGCALGCAFCASGAQGLERHLEVGEIVGQALALRREGKGLTNVVFMGMGEPLLNYEAVLAAARLMNDGHGMGLAARRITISTAGVVPGIRRLADEGLQFGLSVSLHAADDSLRSRLMPINRTYPVAELLAACRYYTDVTGRRISLEYVLLAGINDDDGQARALARRLQGLLCHVNLIPYNAVEGLPYEATSQARILRFQQELSQAGIETTVRVRKGSDIEAACGQLRRRAL